MRTWLLLVPLLLPAAAAHAEQVVVRFITDPPRARVAVDGEPVCGATPCSRVVEAGSHTVTLEHPRFYTFTETRELRRGEARFQFPDHDTRMKVSSWPTGLDLWIGDERLGTTPRTVRVLPGEVRVRVGGDCYQEVVEKHEAHEGQLEQVIVRVDRRTVPLRVDVHDPQGEPVDAEVYADEELVGLAPGVVRIPECARYVQVAAGPDWQAFQSIFRARVQRPESIEVELKPLYDHAHDAASDERTWPSRQSAATGTLQRSDVQWLREATQGPDERSAWDLLLLYYGASGHFAEHCRAARSLVSRPEYADDPQFNAQLALCAARQQKFDEARKAILTAERGLPTLTRELRPEVELWLQTARDRVPLEDAR